MRFIYLFLTATLLYAQLASAQGTASSTIGVPALGFAYDADAAAIRPILGFPGAAVPGDPLDLGFSVASAKMTQTGVILAVSKDDGLLRLVRAENAGLTTRTLDAAMPSPGRIAISPSGRAAALFGPADGRIQLITGLDTTASISRDLTIPGLGSAPLLDVSDDGSSLLAVASGSLWLVTPGSDPVQLPLPEAISGASFRPGAQDAIAVAAGGSIYRLGNSGELTDYRAPSAGVAPGNLVAARLSPNGAQAFLAYAEGTVVTVDLSTGARQAASCGCSPTGLDPVNSSATFRLNELSPQPVWLFDASQSVPRLWFVPAPVAPETLAGAARTIDSQEMRGTR